MTPIAKPVRTEHPFNDQDFLQFLFRRNGPYDCLGVSVPDGTNDDGGSNFASSLPWFRGNWAIAGKAMVDGVDNILFNERFVEAARHIFGAAIVRPTTIVVNLNTPMAAGAPHIDIPSFRGANREHYSLRLLAVMGESGLFERWRIVEAGAVFWLYNGPGGEFDYWPDGLAGAMATESPPFGNIAIVADNNRMYHRVRAVGHTQDGQLRLSAGAQISASQDGGWAITDRGRLVREYSGELVRMSVLWKAEVFDDEKAEELSKQDLLTMERVTDLFASDLRSKEVQFRYPQNPFDDDDWIATLRNAYYQASAAGRL